MTTWKRRARDTFQHAVPSGLDTTICLSLGPDVFVSAVAAAISRQLSLVALARSRLSRRLLLCSVISRRVSVRARSLALYRSTGRARERGYRRCAHSARPQLNDARRTPPKPSPKALAESLARTVDDAMETPLDVLSMAATLIHDQLNKANNKNKDDRGSVDHDSASGGHKELPTRIKKERRRHERHHDLISTAARARREKQVAEEVDDDRPLDMTVNRRGSPPPYRYPSPSDHSGRPSVITCASVATRSSPSPCGSTGSARSAANVSPRPSADAPEAGRRREIISSGVCDPVIDEHFRRSLGERYSHLFANSSSGSSSSAPNSAGLSAPADSSTGSRDGSANKLPSTLNVTGLSVDDHFAKALGETWLKLQSETKEKEAPGDPQPGSPLPSSAQRQGVLLT